MDNRWLTLGIVVAFALAGLVPAAMAGHGDSINDSQTVTFANALTVGTRADCASASPVEGTPAQDATWYSVEAFQEHSFRVQVDGTLDVDPFAYNANDRDEANQCYQMDSDHPWIAPYGGFGVWEYGRIPSNATHLAIDHFAGVGQFTLDVPHPDCDASPNCLPPSAD